MNTEAKSEPSMTAVRLVFMVIAVVLMVVPPFALQMLNLVGKLQTVMIAAVELPILVVGFVLLYLAFRERKPSETKS